MYLPKSFEIMNRCLVETFIQDHPLATVCIHDSGTLTADHLPLLLRAFDPNSDFCNAGTLVGHIAASNPLRQKAEKGIDCLVIFTGIDGYISPNHYATKSVHGKVVPTWNYQAVHCYGRLSIVNDPQWIEALVRELTRVHEQSQAKPWSVDDAPREYLDKMLQAIVGISIQIERVEAKFKMSQNQPSENIESLIAGLAEGNDHDQALAATIRECNP